MAVKTKKVNFTIPLKNGKNREVKGGFEFKAKTGHLAVAHPDLKGQGWSVTLKESGLLVVKGAESKDKAIESALEQLEWLGKDFIDTKINNQQNKLEG